MTRQTILSVTLEVKPESAATLTGLIDAIHHRADIDSAAEPDFAGFMRQVPTVHFLSISMFPSEDFDPVFVLEANIDGAPGPFWQELEAVIGTEMRAMLRCCKQPLDETGPLFRAITQSDAEPVAPYFEARTSWPSAGHQGNRGMTRERIVAERELFLAIRDTLATTNAGDVSPYRGIAADAVHAKLRGALDTKFAWLNESAPTRISIVERLLDGLKLFLFLLTALVVLALPGLLIAICILAGRMLFSRMPAPDCHTLVIWGLVAGAAGIVASIAILIGWIRYLEKRDSSHDAPHIDAETMRQMAQREDWRPQNHMGSIVTLKPGVLRTIIVHAGHRALHLALRVIATNGYLGSMRTVHFAHWSFINNGSRLMFLSNFDHSWESYLDDFIEKAHVGLTLAWGCGVGFPPTRYLIKDGASYGSKFKAWARHSMTVSRFWYSAYPDLTVDQIERNHRIANGLRRKKLGPKAATAWISDL